MKVQRYSNNPIIRPGSGAGTGTNINGPSLIRVPDWLENPLGKYYLYFAHHKGTFIRLTYAQQIAGPWAVYEPGTLKLADSFCDNHIASPDVHVDNDTRRIRLYYHGAAPDGGQVTRVATSADGINFTCLPQGLGNPYFRVFQWGEYYYALGMPGVFYRSKNGIKDFERGPTLFSKDMRHSALKLDDNILSVFYSNAGDNPERILLATIELTDDWMSWRESEAVALLEPQTEYEGADLPLEPSVRGWIPQRVRQLRDPAIFREDGNTYLLYSVAGESGIAIASLTD